MHDFGKNAIHIPIPLTLFHDMTHEHPFVPMNMQLFNAGIVIREGVKNLIERFIDNNGTLFICTDMDHLLLIVEELKITYLPIDNNGDVDRSVLHWYLLEVQIYAHSSRIMLSEAQ
jgi:hypothetical protein